MMPTLEQRFHAIDPSDRCDEPAIVEGCRADYLALKDHHYRAGHPMTMTRILAVRDASPTASQRFLSQPTAPRPIAVLVESLPSLSCRLRDEALGGRYGHLRPKPRSQLLNEELRCISRVLVDPRYRGMGLAVRLVRDALRTATTRYTEALAVMARVSPFFERAGMTAYERPLLESQQRALAALDYVGVGPHELALPSRVAQRIEALAPMSRALLTRELGRWYRTSGGRGVKRSPGLAELLAAAQRGLLANPIYYLKENTHDPTEPARDTDAADRPA